MKNKLIQLDQQEIDYQIINRRFDSDAYGWQDGVYTPKQPSDKAIGLSDENTLRLHSEAWNEIGAPLGYDANTRGNFQYANEKVVKIGLQNKNYHVHLILSNPLKEKQTVTILINDIKESTIELGSISTRTIDFEVALVNPTFQLAVIASDLTNTSVIAPKTIDVVLNELKLTSVVNDQPGEKPTIFISSDSTVQTYAVNEYPQAGWGECLYRYFLTKTTPIVMPANATYKQAVQYRLSNIVIENRSLGGRSSRSFLEEGRLEQLLLNIQPQDYLFIQWSANDATKQRPNRYVSPLGLKKYLSIYVEAALSRGAIPVLVTPPATDHDVDGYFYPSFTDYRLVFKQVSAAYDCCLLDLGEASAAYYNRLGVKKTHINFLQLDKYSYPNFINGVQDKVHYQYFGAEQLAALVSQLINQQIPKLAPYIAPQETISSTLAKVDNITGLVDIVNNCIHLEWSNVEDATFYLIEQGDQHKYVGTTTQCSFNLSITEFVESHNSICLYVSACSTIADSRRTHVTVDLPKLSTKSELSSGFKVVDSTLDDQQDQLLVHIQVDPADGVSKYRIIASDSVGNEITIDEFDSYHVRGVHYYCIPKKYVSIRQQFCKNDGELLSESNSYSIL